MSEVNAFSSIVSGPTHGVFSSVVSAQYSELRYFWSSGAPSRSRVDVRRTHESENSSAWRRSYAPIAHQMHAVRCEKRTNLEPPHCASENCAELRAELRATHHMKSQSSRSTLAPVSLSKRLTKRMSRKSRGALHASKSSRFSVAPSANTSNGKVAIRSRKNHWRR